MDNPGVGLGRTGNKSLTRAIEIPGLAAIHNDRQSQTLSF